MITPYEVLREKARKTEYAVQQREREVRNLPEYAELEQQHRSISAKYMFCNGEESAVLRTQLNEIELKMKQLSKESGADGNRCPVCGGTGFVNGKICSCTLPEIYTRCFGAEDVALFSESFETSDLRLFDDEKPVIKNLTQRDAYKIVWSEAKKYTEKYPAGKEKMLLLSGGTGLGKTFLCRCIAKKISATVPVLYLTAPQLARLFLAHRLGEDIALEYLWRAPFMIIDDLGAEPMHQNVTVEYLFELIDRRLSENRNTVISTNLSLDEIRDRYGDRILSRIVPQKNGLKINFYGNDLRGTK